MKDRVDYLSDKLVNLRGKLKSVDEVIPPDSIANGVSKNVQSQAPAASAQTALERRREQTLQLAADFEQRLARRSRQLELHNQTLSAEITRTAELQKMLQQYKSDLANLRLDENSTYSAAALGECFRNVDRKRLEFFEVDGEIELLLLHNAASITGQTAEKPAVKAEDFKQLLRKGWAMALTVGMVIAAATIASAVIIFMGWR